ncbi:hypothetical protein J40TS1_53220 [Paenibacillus montaniterrae]|uniref:Uncharacterized protein n=1 Tax=Paenibacillus montaniterrae TaxID=429341 RepID=A0A919YU10_9BACL|nr:hypothetical protein [Paenibacillus montaniterrae]GIP19680.1 hypothetical protein J40TS1_53220 [Paenibacillus montaniterrae]
MNKKVILSMVGMMLFGMIAGAGVMMNDEAYKAVKKAFGGGTNNTIGYMGGISGFTPMQLQGLDLETALLMVQQQRTSLLDQQLSSQINDVTARNQTIAEYNTLIGKLYQAKNQSSASIALDKDTNDSLLKHGFVTKTNSSYSSQEIDSIISSLRSKIDATSNSQQMDMLRLQSLTNKRNEAFDVMTNFIKKMQDSRSSIIGNMR